MFFVDDINLFEDWYEGIFVFFLVGGYEKWLLRCMFCICFMVLCLFYWEMWER